MAVLRSSEDWYNQARTGSNITQGSDFHFENSSKFYAIMCWGDVPFHCVEMWAVLLIREYHVLSLRFYLFVITDGRHDRSWPSFITQRYKSRPYHGSNRVCYTGNRVKPIILAVVFKLVPLKSPVDFIDWQPIFALFTMTCTIHRGKMTAFCDSIWLPG